jgi:SAM-dependent methyltransferase
MLHASGTQYDAMGAAYVQKSETSFYNVYYERPNVKALLSNLHDKRVLELGCAGGSLTEWLVAQNAHVTAIDISQVMTHYTQQRIGSQAHIITADISKPLDFLDPASMDIIVASLVLHYIHDWLPVFHEFDRILADKGEIVISTHHPHADWYWHDRPNYFTTELYEETWTISGKTYPISYYHRPLADMFAVFHDSGFYIDALREPSPLSEAQSKNPAAFHRLTTRPHFLFIRLKKLAS